MLSFFRRVMTSWVMLGLLAILAIAFVLSGVGDPFGGSGVAPGAVAKVGGKTITEADFTKQFDRFMTRAREQNPALTNSAAAREGGVEAVLGQIESRAALVEFAKKQGLTASDRSVDGQIASIPAFQRGGTFDQTAYAAALAQQRISEHELRDDVRAEQITRQVLAPMSIPGSLAPRLLAAPYADLLLEARKGSIAVIPSQRFAAGLTPTDAQLQAYYREKAARYTIPERRSLRYALLSKEMASSTVTVSDEDVAAYYKDHADVYGGVAQRSLSQVVTPDKGVADKIAARVKAGEPFAKVAQELAGYGAEDLALGVQTQDKLAKATSPAVAAAAFTLPAGSITAPVKSDFGWHVVRVDSVVGTKVRPLATVRNEIVTALKGDKAEDVLAKEVADIQDALAQGQSLVDVAKAHKLTVMTTPPMTRDGRVQQPGFRLEPDLAPLLAKGFAAQSGDEPTVEQLSPERVALLDIAETLPPAPTPLAQIRAAVAADWARSQALGKAKAAADAVAADVGKGVPMAQALTSRGLPAAQQVGGRRIELGQNGRPVPPPLALLFALPNGAVRTLAAPNDAGWFVVKVDGILKGDAQTNLNLLGELQGQIARTTPDELAGQFARAVAAQVGVQRNAKAVAEVRKRYLGEGAAGAP